MATIGFKPNGETLVADAITGSPTNLRATKLTTDFAVYRYPTADGTLSRVGIRVNSGADGSRQVKVALYNSSLALLAHATLTPSNAFTGVMYANLNTPVSVSAATEYVIAFQISNGNLNLDRENVALNWDNASPGAPAFGDAFPNPLVVSTTTSIGRVAIWLEDSGVSGLTITSITPSQIDSGESFTITGTGFGATQGLSLVQIGGVTQTPTSWSDSSITCTATRGSQSMGNATLTIYKM